MEWKSIIDFAIIGIGEVRDWAINNQKKKVFILLNCSNYKSQHLKTIYKADYVD